MITLLYAVGSLAFHYVLGDPAPAREVLWSTLFQAIALNLLLDVAGLRARARVLLPRPPRRERVERCTPLASTTGNRAERFLPPDPRVEEPYLLTPRMALRVAILGAIALVVFAVLFLRLWSLQILSGSKYEPRRWTTSSRTFPIEAQRGPILDRKGRMLVTNVASTAVEVSPVDLPKQGRYAEMKRALEGPQRAAPEAAAHASSRG